MAHKAFLAALGTAVALASCQPARNLETQWVKEVRLTLDDRPTSDERYAEVLQVRPNTNVFGSFPYVWLYQCAKPGSASGFANWLRRIGEQPILWDSLATEKDIQQLILRLKQDGYFFPAVHYALTKKKRGLHLKYALVPGLITRVSQVSYLSMGPGIDPFLPALEEGSLLQSDQEQGLTMEFLDAERRRIADLLQEQGFFTFGPEAVHFEVDTIGHPFSASVTVRLENWTRSSEYGTVEEPHRIWIVRKTTGSWPSTLQLNPIGIDRLPWLPTGQPFRASQVQSSTSQLRRIPALQSGRWQFAMVQDSLNATLSLVPSPRVGITWKGESTALSGIYGLQSSVDLFDNNPWGGLENVHLILSGGIGAQWADSSALFNTYFIDVESGVQWPGILGWRDAPVQSASTRLSISAGRQYRREFDRLAARAAVQYQWTDKQGGQWELSPTDLTYIDLRQIDSSFYQALSIKSGFQDVLLLGPRLRMVRPSVQHGRWERRTEWTMETSGILTDLLVRGIHPTGPEVRTIGAVPYAHYLRAMLDMRWLYRGTKHRDWAIRGVLGELYTFRNTPGLPPFERAFFAGGSNDLRAWINFRLGPGALPLGVFDSSGYLGSGTRKLLFQTEYRFPLSGSLSGALFSDLGNTWLTARNIGQAANPLFANPSIQERVVFHPARVMEQSAWDAGAGLRYDLDFFILRVDWGIQIYDPRRLGSQPWFRLTEWDQRGTLNFGLGMPF